LRGLDSIPAKRQLLEDDRRGIAEGIVSRRPYPVLLMARELGIGGCERDLAKLALGLDRTKYIPHAGCFREGFRAPELRAAGIPIPLFPVTSFVNASLWKGVWALRRYVKQHGIVLIHGFDVPGSIFGGPAGRLCGVPAVVTSMLGSRDLVNGLERRLLRFSDRTAHRVMVNAEATKRHLIEDEAVPAEKIFVNHNGYDPAIFYPASGSENRPAALADARLVIGIVCALRTEKNVSLLVEAFRRVHQPGVKLLILGSGPLLPALEQQIEEGGLGGDCVLEPARPDVADWFRAIDIFVLPSVSESFPNALLEAMASGCAAVATRVGGIPELIADGRTGLLFANGNVEELAAHLRRLIEDSSFRRQLGRQAAAAAREEFPISRYCRQMEDFYDSLLLRNG